LEVESGWEQEIDAACCDDGDAAGRKRQRRVGDPNPRRWRRLVRSLG
jgi:hypothetical protein